MKQNLMKHVRLNLVGLLLLSFIFIQAYPGSVLHSQDPSGIKHTSQSETITIDELKKHITILASDSMGGRPAESKIYEKAAAYAVEEFRYARLLPPFTDEKGTKTYYQPVPFLKRLPGDKSRLIIKTADGETTFFESEHFKMNYCCHSDFPEGPLPIVFIGYGIEEPDAGWNDYEGLNLEGKLAVAVHGVPMQDTTAVLPRELHEKYSSREGYRVRYESMVKRKIAGLIWVAENRLLETWEDLYKMNFRIGLFYDGDAPSKIPMEQLWGPQGNRIYVKQDVVKILFQNQTFSPVGIEGHFGPDYRTFELENVSVAYEKTASAGRHVSYNIAAWVEGVDPDLKHEYVTIGAHLDHLPSDGGPIFNGADDNASGVAGVLEIAESIAANPLRRSVLFVLYTAEEMGLYGARHFVHHFPVAPENIVANINLDMIGRSTPDNAETRAEYVEDADSIDSAFKTLIDEVNSKTVNWPLIHQSSSTSDHSIYLEHEINAASFFSGFHPDFHQPTDDADKIDYEKVAKLSKLAYEIIRELGNTPVLPFLQKNTGVSGIKYVHTNIIAKDWKLLTDFYVKVFNCKPLLPEMNLKGDWLEKGTGVKGASLQGMHLLLPGYDKSGPTLEIFKYKKNEKKPASLANREGIRHIAFSVDDVDAVLKKMLLHGGKKIGEVIRKDFESGIFIYTYAADPEGNIIEIQKWEPKNNYQNGKQR